MQNVKCIKCWYVECSCWLRRGSAGVRPRATVRRMRRGQTRLRLHATVRLLKRKARLRPRATVRRWPRRRELSRQAELVAVSSAFRFTEGPAADAAGNIYFTDQPNDQIMIYTVDGELKQFMQPSGRSNGMYFDTDGTLIACATIRTNCGINVETKEHVVLTQRYEGGCSSRANDAGASKKRWISAPIRCYRRQWWDRSPASGFLRGAYRINHDGTGWCVIDNRQAQRHYRHAGRKTLYVADIDEQDPGFRLDRMARRLTDKRLFCEAGSDGMTLDCCGNGI